MRWRLEMGGEFLRYVDADEVRASRHGGREFVRHTGDGAVSVLTISPFVYVRETPVPTFRLVGGPKDGQVCAAPDSVPEYIYFQPVVALGEDGGTLAPVPPRQLAELSDVYVHHLFDCPCRGSMRGAWEHVYVWPETLYGQMAKLSGEAERGGAPV